MVALPVKGFLLMHDVSMVVTGVIAVATFIVGFLSSLFIWGGRFVSKSACIETRRVCEAARGGFARRSESDEAKMEATLEKMQKQIVLLHVVMVAVATELKIDIKSLTNNLS
jgi:hypothetical protein